MRKCRVCGCTDDNCSQCIKKTGEPCYWIEDDFCSACVDTPNLGKCCGCETEIGVRNVILLDKKQPAGNEGKGWGCFICGLPAEGASAVLCDTCFNKLDIKFACVGYPEDNIRIPIEELKEEFKHNMEMHKEEILS